MVSSTFTSDRSISNTRVVWLGFLLRPCFIEIPVYKAISVDPDQTPRSAASDLGLYYFLMSLLWDARLKWVDVRLKGTLINRTEVYQTP